jgi:hypothetical protein
VESAQYSNSIQRAPVQQDNIRYSGYNTSDALCVHFLQLPLWKPHTPPSAEYIVVVIGRELVGQHFGQDVYRATKFELLPLNPNVNVYQPPHPVEGHLLALLQSHLNSGFFLFSYGVDLSRRLQVQYETVEADKTKALWEVVRTYSIFLSWFTEYEHSSTTGSFGINMLKLD